MSVSPDRIGACLGRSALLMRRRPPCVPKSPACSVSLLFTSRPWRVFLLFPALAALVRSVTPAMSPAAMDGTPDDGSAAASSRAPAAGAAAPPGEQSSLAGVLERADALAVASPADAEPLYRRIIDGESDLVVTPADDVNAMKQAAIIGTLPRAWVRERDLLGICCTLCVLCTFCLW